MYLKDQETELLIAAIDCMLESLPTKDNVPEVDAIDAERDRLAYFLLRNKLLRYHNRRTGKAA
jgi:hypothetical protein